MNFKVIRDENDGYYNSTKDKFQTEFTKDCLLDEAFANLTIMFLDNCKIETYQLVKIQ